MARKEFARGQQTLPTTSETYLRTQQIVREEQVMLEKEQRQARRRLPRHDPSGRNPHIGI